MRNWIGGAAVIAALGMLAMITQGPEEGAAKPPVAPPEMKAVVIAAKPHAPRTIDYALIDGRLKRLMEDNAMVGLAVGIVEDGQITYLRGYGETLAGTGNPVTADTVFRWASVSKGLASTLVAGLAADGKLSLDDPVAGYAASLHLPGGGEARATVADVLSHRVGVHGNANDPPLEDGGDARYLRSTLATLPLICPVGTCHAYQNVAYDAASEIVEKVTGRPYADVAAARVFGPLGMTSASVSRAGLVSSPSWARPHDGSGRPQPRGLSEAYYRVPAAGGVNSSIRDLARWMQAQMGEAPIAVPAAVLETVHTPRVPTPRENRRQRKFSERVGGATYALGWRNYDYAGHRVVTHHGGLSGYRASMMFDPVKRSGVVTLWNSGSGQPWGLDYEVMDMVYGLDRRDWLGLDTPKGQPAVPLSPVATATLAHIGR